MNRNLENPNPSANPAVCPHCGTALSAKGKIVDSGKYKKWSDEWYCPTHGKIDVPEPTKSSERDAGSNA